MTAAWTGRACHSIGSALVASCALLAACAQPGKVEPPPALELPASFEQADEVHAAWDGPWWQRFGDAQLAALVDQAIQANHDVRLALQRVKQAQAAQVPYQSALWPDVSAVGTASQSRTGLPAEVKQDVPDTRVTSLGVQVGWELDLFGGNRAGARAAESDVQASEFMAVAARLAVAGEVARHYFMWRGARERMEVMVQLLKTQQEVLRLRQRRHGDGLEGQLPADTAQADTARVAAQLAHLHTLDVVIERRLATLLGRTTVPTMAADGPEAWGDVPHIAAGQPGELLWRRPDLRAAEHRLVAEGERLEWARAQRWPRLFISALVGREALSLNAMNFAPTHLVNAAAVFAMPLFNAGRVSAGIDQQSAVRESARLLYDQAVLRALEDVEVSLANLQDRQERIVRTADELGAREASLKRHAALLREGQVGRLPWLELRRAVLQTRLDAIDVKEGRAIAAVQLYLALGGGWQAVTQDTVPRQDGAARPRPQPCISGPCS